jgi:uncharacterized membrane protein YgcG
MYPTELDTLPMHTTYAIYLVKGLFIAMINLAIIHKKLSVNGFIICCIIPFIIAFILLFRADFIYFIAIFTSTLLIDIKTDNILTYDLFNKLKHYIHILKTVNFNEIKNFLISLVHDQLSLHTLGGSPEECKKTLYKSGNANVNYTKSSGEPSGGRRASSETSDLYGSGESASPQAFDSGVGSGVGSGESASNQGRPVTISPYTNSQASGTVIGSGIIGDSIGPGGTSSGIGSGENTNTSDGTRRRNP